MENLTDDQIQAITNFTLDFIIPSIWWAAGLWFTSIVLAVGVAWKLCNSHKDGEIGVLNQRVIFSAEQLEKAKDEVDKAEHKIEELNQALNEKDYDGARASSESATASLKTANNHIESASAGYGGGKFGEGGFGN